MQGTRRGTPYFPRGGPTPDALAAPFAFLEGHYLCPLIDAKKGEVFFALYRVSDGAVIRIGDFRSCKPEDVPPRIGVPCLCFGTGVGLCRRQLAGVEGLRVVEDGFQRVSGEALLQTGLVLAARQDRPEAKPIYGRKSEAEIKFNIDVS